MSASVVAMLLPRATITLPRRSMSSRGIWVMFAYCASSVAASSAVRLVATPRLATTFVNCARLSVSTPSCPAAAISPARSTAVCGITSDMSHSVSSSSA